MGYLGLGGDVGCKLLLRTEGLISKMLLEPENFQEPPTTWTPRGGGNNSAFSNLAVLLSTQPPSTENVHKPHSRPALRAKPSRARAGHAEPNGTETSLAGPSRTERSRAEPGHAEPEQNRAEPSRAGQGRAKTSRLDPSWPGPTPGKNDLFPPTWFYC